MDLKKNFQSKSAVTLFLKDFVNYIKAGHCIFLFGDLGVGKTYFSQQIIKSFTSEEFVSSPTYNIVNTYKYNDDVDILHCDLYRLNSYDEVLELGILDNLDKKILLVEWPNFLENKMAEGKGFEPPEGVSSFNDLANRRLQPLGHPSANFRA